ncbi:MAG: ComEC/Rec2-related protein, competence protein ComEC [Parcubacteria group bacterium GW2011_GWC1_38_6]|nr:MAG: ComEC/Rec2-related protein, competence protein ComEC [Parcubacteria group bacterium GW2011_GWC1_38_6]
MTASKILLYICLAFVIGVFSGPFLNFSLAFEIIVALFGMATTFVFWRHQRAVAVGLCLLFFVFGLGRYQVAENKAIDSELLFLNDNGKIVALTGYIVTEPDIRDKSIKLTIAVENLVSGKTAKDITGKVLVTTDRYSNFQYGDRLKIKGDLETPPIFDSFNYRNYLKKDGIYSIMNWPEIEPIGDNVGNKIIKFLFSFKNKFKEATRSFISPPQEGILEALVFGDEQDLSQEWKEKLNLTGTRHIAAVSGMNITITAFLILSFALSLGLWRQQAFFVSILLLSIYILMIGAPASAVRAGIMGFILIAAQYSGRLSVASRAVVFAAAIMIYQNPFILKLDIGFQLSFLAIVGLIYLQPTFSRLLSKIPNPKAFPVRTTLVATLSAQVFTAPILIYNFGYLPILSPITNILIVPFLAPITILIFVFGIICIIFPLAGFLLSWPVWLSLTYIIGIIGWFSQFSFAALTIQNIHWFWLALSYVCLTAFVFYLSRKERLNFLNY